MASSRRRYITKTLILQHGETPGCSACLGIASQHTAKSRERFEKLINPNATDVIPAVPTRRQCSASRATATGGPAWHKTPRAARFRHEERHGGQFSAIVSEESSHATSRLVPDLDECSAGPR